MNCTQNMLVKTISKFKLETIHSLALNKYNNYINLVTVADFELRH